jgi:aminoglycoside-2''-adenylyltransferase
VREDPPVTWAPFDVATVQRLFAPLDARWWLSGGVALEVFVGASWREHGDVDVSVWRGDWSRIGPHVVDALEVHVAKDGVLTPLAEWEVTDEVRNLWARERDGGPWRVQVNLEDGDDARWRYRRDERVTRDWSDVIWHHGALPFVNPAVQLLWKARDVTAKDQFDFDAVAPRLPAVERAWLAEAIALAHPGSRWNTT